MHAISKVYMWRVSVPVPRRKGRSWARIKCFIDWLIRICTFFRLKQCSRSARESRNAPFLMFLKAIKDTCFLARDGDPQNRSTVPDHQRHLYQTTYVVGECWLSAGIHSKWPLCSPFVVGTFMFLLESAFSTAVKYVSTGQSSILSFLGDNVNTLRSPK